MSTRWEVHIPWWRPAALNELLKGGPWGAAWLKKNDLSHVCVFAHWHHVPRATGKRRISLKIVLPPKQRRWDIDALQKSTLDACVTAGMLKDDGPKWAEWGGVEYTRGKSLSTTIVIEDLPHEEFS
jgi:hypothetical protein